MSKNCFADKDLAVINLPKLYRNGRVIPQGLRFKLRYANLRIATIVKCGKCVLAIFAATVFAMTNAIAQRASPLLGSYVNDVLVARCEAGNLHVVEAVDTNTGARGGVSAAFDILFVSERDRTSKRIGLTLDGSYKTAASDRLAIFRTPQEGDSHLFVPPRLFGSAEYESLVSCIAQNMPNIYDKMAISRPPHDEFPSRDMRFLPIASIRYSDLNDIHKRYQCGAGARIDVEPSGRVELTQEQANGSFDRHLFGVILDNGTTMAVEEPPLQFGAIAPLPTYLARCKTTAGTSLVQEFNVQVMARGSVIKAIGGVRKRAGLIGLPPTMPVAPSRQ